MFAAVEKEYADILSKMERMKMDGKVKTVTFSERLKGYKTSKGTVQLPYSKPLPLELIKDIARWCYETGNHP